MDAAKVMVVMPARNAARTLEQTVSAIPTDVVDEIILVDDGSTDGTLELARRLPLHLIWHPHNVGYGGNQKTCYLEALQRDADVVVMLHPDGQYEPSLIPRMVEPILRRGGRHGARLAAGGRRRLACERHAPLQVPRQPGLTGVENAVLGTHFSELHTGYRAFSRRLLLTVPFLRNSIDFVFDSEMIMQAVHFGFRIVEVPARTRYFTEASSASAGQSVVYGAKTLVTAARFMLHRSGHRALAKVHALSGQVSGRDGDQVKRRVGRRSGPSEKSSGWISAAPGGEWRGRGSAPVVEALATGGERDAAAAAGPGPEAASSSRRSASTSAW